MSGTHNPSRCDWTKRSRVGAWSVPTPELTRLRLSKVAGSSDGGGRLMLRSAPRERSTAFRANSI